MVVVHVVDMLVVGRPDDDDAAAHPQDIDVGAVQLGSVSDVSTSSGVPIAHAPGAR